MATESLRAWSLPAIAVVLVSGVIGVEIANGGGQFTPVEPADPCAARTVSSVSTGIDGLAEQVVLRGLDNAACQLGTTREALILTLAQSGTATDAQVDALHDGLLEAVDQMKADGTLPPASDFTDEALENSDLNGFLQAAIRALPDSVIDAALPTDDVLRRTIDNLDLRELLSNVNDQDALTSQIAAAVTVAVEDSLIARLGDLL